MIMKNQQKLQNANQMESMSMKQRQSCFRAVKQACLMVDVQLELQWLIYHVVNMAWEKGRVFLLWRLLHHFAVNFKYLFRINSSPSKNERVFFLISWYFFYGGIRMEPQGFDLEGNFL